MPSNQLEALMQCGCCGAVCCPGRDCPGSGTPNALPDTLTLEIYATYDDPPTTDPPNSGFDPPANSTCFDFSVELQGACPNGIITYGGTGENTCTWCNKTFTIRVNVILTCSGVDGWVLSFETPTPSIGSCDVNVVGEVNDIALTQAACDPLLLYGDLPVCRTCSNFWCQVGSIQLPGGAFVPVLAYHSAFCLHVVISENP